MPSIDILLCEDNPADVDLVAEGFEQVDTPLQIHHVADGELAVKFLNREPPYADAPRPRLILMDLNLPRRDGLSVLTHIREEPELRTIPVIIISSSAAKRDIDRSYALGANCYITKPMKFDAFQLVVRSIDSFWFGTVQLPSAT